MTTKNAANRKSADAKLFWNGRSQAVRLPKEFRFEGDRVRVRRMGAGVLLEPVSEIAQGNCGEAGLHELTHCGAIQFFLRVGGRSLRRFVSTSSELPVRYQYLHCTDQWELPQSARVIL